MLVIQCGVFDCFGLTGRGAGASMNSRVWPMAGLLLVLGVLTLVCLGPEGASCAPMQSTRTINGDAQALKDLASLDTLISDIFGEQSARLKKSKLTNFRQKQTLRFGRRSDPWQQDESLEQAARLASANIRQDYE